MSNKIFDDVSGRILKQLDEGVIPWHAPWIGYGELAPRSHLTGEVYSFLNQILLGRPGEYVTFGATVAEGGRVKKGAKAKAVYFWSVPKNDKEDEEDEEDGKDGKLLKKRPPMMRKFNVFHLDDTEGLEPKTAIEKELRNNEGVDVDERAEEVWRKYCERENLNFEVDKLSATAVYSPMLDRILVPSRKQFKSEAEYYSTLFHELVHSTGHEKRLKRNTFGYGTDEKARAREELVAEIGASVLCKYVGVDSEGQFQNNVAYIERWKSFLEEEKGAFIYAACRAQKAVDFILGKSPKHLDECDKYFRFNK